MAFKLGGARSLVGHAIMPQLARNGVIYNGAGKYSNAHLIIILNCHHRVAPVMVLGMIDPQLPWNMHRAIVILYVRMMPLHVHIQCNWEHLCPVNQGDGHLISSTCMVSSMSSATRNGHLRHTYVHSPAPWQVNQKWVYIYSLDCTGTTSHHAF